MKILTFSFFYNEIDSCNRNRLIKSSTANKLSLKIFLKILKLDIIKDRMRCLSNIANQYMLFRFNLRIYLKLRARITFRSDHIFCLITLLARSSEINSLIKFVQLCSFFQKKLGFIPSRKSIHVVNLKKTKAINDYVQVKKFN